MLQSTNTSSNAVVVAVDDVVGTFTVVVDVEVDEVVDVVVEVEVVVTVLVEVNVDEVDVNVVVIVVEVDVVDDVVGSVDDSNLFLQTAKPVPPHVREQNRLH